MFDIVNTRKKVHDRKRYIKGTGWTFDGKPKCDWEEESLQYRLTGAIGKAEEAACIAYALINHQDIPHYTKWRTYGEMLLGKNAYTLACQNGRTILFIYPMTEDNKKLAGYNAVTWSLFPSAGYQSHGIFKNPHKAWVALRDVVKNESHFLV